MEILIPHYGMWSLTCEQFMKDGSGRFITSLSKEVINEYIAEKGADSKLYKVVEFSRGKSCSTSDMVNKTNKGFNYVDVVGEGREGWLNLFHNDDIVCLERVAAIADEIRATTPERL